MLSSSAATYGYTVTIWSSGALLTHYRGAPGVLEVFLFAAGAIAAFTLFALVAPTQVPTFEPGRRRVVAGALDWLATGAAVGAVALLAQIRGAGAWPLSSFAATLLYAALAGLQTALAGS